MKNSEVFKIAQHCVLAQLPVDTEEQREVVLEVLAALKKEENMALRMEEIKSKESEGEKC